MRIYTASCSAAWQRVRDFNADAEAAGHVITEDWPRQVATMLASGGSEGALSPTDAWQHALADLKGVYAAEVVVFLADEGDYCGALIEYGAALATGVPVLLVAPWRPSIFWHSPRVTIVPDENAAREALGMRLLAVAE